MSRQTSSFWLPGELGYCSNVHAGESLTEVIANFSRFIAPVRQQQQLEQLDSGLWLSAAAAAELQQPTALLLFQQQLQLHAIRLTSLNGFPFGNFHQAKVKTSAYLPDWSEPKRLHYSKQLAVILASCLPDDCGQGVISTVPLGYQAHWTAEKQQQAEQQGQCATMHRCLQVLQLARRVSMRTRRFPSNVRMLSIPLRGP
mgnify:CR=1 FL=1